MTLKHKKKDPDLLRLASLLQKKVDDPGSYGKERELVSRIIDHRLRQDDLKKITGQLGKKDLEAFAYSMSDVLRRSLALLEIKDRVADSLSLDVLLPRIVHMITELLDADRSTLFVNDEQTGILYSLIAEGNLTRKISFPNTQGIAGAVFCSGRSEIVSDAYEDSRFNQEVDQQTGYHTRNLLCAPVRASNGRVIGVTEVLNKKGKCFDENDLLLLETLTEQTAAALINAQKFEEIVKLRKEEKHLLEIAAAISQEVHLDPLLKKIMQAVTNTLDADRSTLFLYDQETDELCSHLAQGLEEKTIRFPYDIGIAGACYRKQSTINIPEAYQDQRFNKAVDRETGYRTRSILSMPVINRRGKILGVVQTLNKKVGAFTHIDEQHLETFCAQAAIAIENTQLFEEVLTAKNYNESILESLSNGIVTVNTHGKITTVNHAGLWLFRKGNTPQQMIGRQAETFFTGQNEWIVSSLQQVIRTGKPYNAADVKLWLLPAEESANWPAHKERRRHYAIVNCHMTPLKDSSQTAMGCLITLEDITVERRLRSTLGRYMTKQVADKVYEDEAVLGGQLQLATVLFSDIRGFTSISEKLGPQETVSMLNHYFSEMVDIILSHNGILDKFIGDAIMAVFGVPVSSGPDADHAVRAALNIVKALPAMNEAWVQGGNKPISIGIGINTDQVLSGNIGSIKRMDFTVIGDGVNLASRLEGANKMFGSKILASEFTIENLTGCYLMREIDRIRVKGKKQPVAIFEILGEKDANTDESLVRSLALFEQGLQYYRKQKWSAAVEVFTENSNLMPADIPTKIYLDRCQQFMQSHPGPDWDGVWTMNHK